MKVGSMAYDSGKGMQTAEEIKKWFLSKDENPGEKETLSKPLFEVLPGTILLIEYFFPTYILILHEVYNYDCTSKLILER